MHKKQITKIHTMKILTVTLHILLKRDMSLNRRIYEWLLGTEHLSQNGINQQHLINDSSSYFIQYTRDILIESLRNLLRIIATRPALIITKSDEDNNKPVVDIIGSLSSTWTLTKLIRVLLALGM
jgi:hypothetical protein